MNSSIISQYNQQHRNSNWQMSQSANNEKFKLSNKLTVLSSLIRYVLIAVISACTENKMLIDIYIFFPSDNLGTIHNYLLTWYSIAYYSTILFRGHIISNNKLTTIVGYWIDCICNMLFFFNLLKVLCVQILSLIFLTLHKKTQMYKWYISLEIALLHE